MEIDDILNKNASLLGGDPSGVDVAEASAGEITASCGGKVVGVLMYDPKSFAIMRLDVSDDNSSGSVATALMRRICELADRVAATVIIPDALAQVPSVSATRFVEKFGFVKNSRGQLARKPGGALPYSVLL